MAGIDGKGSRGTPEKSDEKTVSPVACAGDVRRHGRKADDHGLFGLAVGVEREREIRELLVQRIGQRVGEQDRRRRYADLYR